MILIKIFAALTLIGIPYFFYRLWNEIKQRRATKTWVNPWVDFVNAGAALSVSGVMIYILCQPNG